MNPRCSVFIATSLDGFIAEDDGALDFLAVVEDPATDYGYGEFIASVDAVVMGRATYEVGLGFAVWPYSSQRVVVLTSGLPQESVNGEEFSRRILQHSPPGSVRRECGASTWTAARPSARSWPPGSSTTS